MYPGHEQQVARIVREAFPDAYLSLSHRVLAEFREYERLSTTVVNAFVGPVMSNYIDRLRERVSASGMLADPHITQSNGGVISLDVVRESPVRTILSGPAAGVTGAVHVAALAGVENVITFDMGGTSTDVALILEGRPGTGLELEIDGIPVRTPMIDINTVGAGGGSIAWIDSGGHMKVGPRSAGAEPGPAAYGRGGNEATVTDANVALGILNRESILGGRMPLDAKAADAAIERLAGQLGIEPLTAADGVLAIVTANMARAIRVISVERGHDPRDFTLVAFGGAGPLHASRLARQLDIKRILVPRVPGILCAVGLLMADLRVDVSRSNVMPVAIEALPEVLRLFADLEAEALGWMMDEQIEEPDRGLRRVADMRYAGQNYELSIEIPAGDVTPAELVEVLVAFHAAHELAYGFASPGEPAQFVTLRLEATGRVKKAQLAEIERASGSVEEAWLSTRDAFLPDAGLVQDCPVLDRDRLRWGHAFSGPAIVEQMDATTVVLPGQQVEVDRYGNLLITEAVEAGT